MKKDLAKKVIGTIGIAGIIAGGATAGHVLIANQHENRVANSEAEHHMTIDNADLFLQSDEEMMNAITDEIAYKSAENSQKSQLDSIAEDFFNAQDEASSTTGEQEDMEKAIENLEKNQQSEENNKKIQDVKKAQGLVGDETNVKTPEEVSNDGVTDAIAESGSLGEEQNALNEVVLPWVIFGSACAALLAGTTAVATVAIKKRSKNRSLSTLATRVKLGSENEKKAIEINNLASKVITAHKNGKQKQIIKAERDLKLAISEIENNNNRQDLKIKYAYASKALKLTTPKRAYTSRTTVLPSKSAYEKYMDFVNYALSKEADLQKKGKNLESINVSAKREAKLTKILGNVFDPNSYYGEKHFVQIGHIKFPLFPSEYVNCNTYKNANQENVKTMFNKIQESFPFVDNKTHIKTIVYTENGIKKEVRCAMANEIGANAMQSVLLNNLPDNAKEIHLIDEVRGNTRFKDSRQEKVFENKAKVINEIQKITDITQILDNNFAKAETAPTKISEPEISLNQSMKSESMQQQNVNIGEKFESETAIEIKEIENQIAILQTTLNTLIQKQNGIREEINSLKENNFVKEDKTASDKPQKEIVKEIKTVEKNDKKADNNIVNELSDRDYVRQHPYVVHLSQDGTPTIEFLKQEDREFAKTRDVNNPYYTSEHLADVNKVFDVDALIEGNLKDPIIVFEQNGKYDAKSFDELESSPKAVKKDVTKKPRKQESKKTIFVDPKEDYVAKHPYIIKNESQEIRTLIYLNNEDKEFATNHPHIVHIQKDGSKIAEMLKIEDRRQDATNPYHTDQHLRDLDKIFDVNALIEGNVKDPIVIFEKDGEYEAMTINDDIQKRQKPIDQGKE